MLRRRSPLSSAGPVLGLALCGGFCHGCFSWSVSLRGNGWRALLCQSAGCLLEPVAFALELKQLGPVHQAIQDGGGHGVVAEVFAPVLHHRLEVTTASAMSDR